MYLQVNAKVLFDCCQSVPGRPMDVQQLGADWIVGAGHKMCGPTGSAFLWGKSVALPPSLSPAFMYYSYCFTCCPVWWGCTYLCWLCCCLVWLHGRYFCLLCSCPVRLGCHMSCVLFAAASSKSMLLQCYWLTGVVGANCEVQYKVLCTGRIWYPLCTDMLDNASVTLCKSM